MYRSARIFVQTSISLLILYRTHSGIHATYVQLLEKYEKAVEICIGALSYGNMDSTFVKTCYANVRFTFIIEREAREIMYLVASVRLSVCPTSHG